MKKEIIAAIILILLAGCQQQPVQEAKEEVKAEETPAVVEITPIVEEDEGSLPFSEYYGEGVPTEIRAGESIEAKEYVSANEGYPFEHNGLNITLLSVSDSMQQCRLAINSIDYALQKGELLRIGSSFIGVNSTGKWTVAFCQLVFYGEGAKSAGISDVREVHTSGTIMYNGVERSVVDRKLLVEKISPLYRQSVDIYFVRELGQVNDTDGEVYDAVYDYALQMILINKRSVKQEWEEAALWHELGHHWYSTQLTQAQKEEWEQIHSAKSSFITAHASENAKEDFGEVFACAFDKEMPVRLTEDFFGSCPKYLAAEEVSFMERVARTEVKSYGELSDDKRYTP